METVNQREKIAELLTEAALRSRNNSFLPDYRASITDYDALGVAISNWTHFDGDKIAECFFSALEDANCHSIRHNFVLLWNDAHDTNIA